MLQLSAHPVVTTLVSVNSRRADYLLFKSVRVA